MLEFASVASAGANYGNIAVALITADGTELSRRSLAGCTATLAADAGGALDFHVCTAWQSTDQVRVACGSAWQSRYAMYETRVSLCPFANTRGPLFLIADNRCEWCGDYQYTWHYHGV